MIKQIVVHMSIKSWKNNKIWYTIIIFKYSDEEIVIIIKLNREFTLGESKRNLILWIHLLVL